MVHGTASTLAVVVVVLLHPYAPANAFNWLNSPPAPPQCELRHWVWYEWESVEVTQLVVEYVPLEAVPTVTTVTTTLRYPNYITSLRSVTMKPEVVKVR